MSKEVSGLLDAVARRDVPSYYQAKYVDWVGIRYDRDMLLDLVEHLGICKSTPGHCSADYIAMLEKILIESDLEHLRRLIENDEQTVRLAMIEKWARTSAMEVLIDNKYSVNTLNTITQFPLADYQLIVKRTQELVGIISDITTQATSVASGIAGV